MIRKLIDVGFHIVHGGYYASTATTAAGYTDIH